MALTIQEYQRKIREVRIQQAAPSVFRAIFMSLGGGSMVETVDNITEEIRDTEITPYGEMKVIGDFTGKTGVPLTTFDATRSTTIVRTACIAYEIADHELERMNANNVPIRNLKAAANLTIAERFLEDCVLLGSTQYSFGSLLTNASVATVAAVTKAATGLTWAVATFEEIVTDILAAHYAVKNNSFKRWSGNTIVIPDVQFQRASLLVHPYTSKNAITTARERCDGAITRVLPVSQCSGAGAGATNRLMCFDANPFVCQMTEKPFAEYKTRETDVGFKTIEYLRTGGTIWNDIAGAVYMDGI
jgi:hypothetical protein